MRLEAVCGGGARAYDPVTRVAVLWHMHQPSYRDPLDGTFVLPWVRLHALKDYWGMVAILAETPDVHVTFNMVPSLLDQLEEYVSGARPRSRAAALGLAPGGSARRDGEGLPPAGLVHGPSREPDRPLPALRRAALALRGPRHDEASLRVVVPRFGPAEMRDLQVLAKLAWFDLEWQKDDPALRALIAKGRDYTEDDKRDPRRARAGPPGRGHPRLSPRRRRGPRRAVRLALLPPDPASPLRHERAPGGAPRRLRAAALSAIRRTRPTRSSARSTAPHPGVRTAAFGHVAVGGIGSRRKR